VAQLHGPKPPQAFTCDGCTFSPDGMFGIDWREACRWHDWAYRSNARLSRFRADWYLFRNMRTLGCPLFTAGIYFLAVRLLGWRFWKKGTHPWHP
jgi:hypothetical protein